MLDGAEQYEGNRATLDNHDHAPDEETVRVTLQQDALRFTEDGL